ncbi:hypothetical protein BGZ47_002546 [Haplosporangium gracile]|nr:hypothetical protein BGZ47_002546 [Haplosporangium gracile]
MRITPDPFGSPSSKHASPSSSATSLNTLANAPALRPLRTIKPPVKAIRQMFLQSQLLFNSTATTSDTAPVPAPSARRSEDGKQAVEEEPCSVSVSPAASLPPQETPTSSQTSTANHSKCHRPPLKVETLQQPSLWRSQSRHALVSPNQLQGVVVESFKTPVNTKHSSLQPPSSSSSYSSQHFGIEASSSGPNDNNHGLVFEPYSSEQKGIPWMLYQQPSQSTSAISSPSSSSPSSGSSMRSSAGMVVDAAASVIASAFGSHVWSTSGSQERQEQQQVLMSARSIEPPLESMFGIDTLYSQPSPTLAPVSLGKRDIGVKVDTVATEEDFKIEEPTAPSSESNTPRQTSSRPVLLPPSTPMSTFSSGLPVPPTAPGGGPWSDEDDQSSSASTDTEVEMESEVDDQTGSLHVHRSARRTNSSRTGGKSHYSAYRRRIQSISLSQQLQLEQQQQEVQQQPHEQEKNLYDSNHPAAGNSISSTLAVSTAGLAAAKRNSQEMDGTHSMHFFNRHLQRVQQQASGGNERRQAGYVMDASRYSKFSNSILSPTSCTTITSVHSVMTAGSGTSSYAPSTTSGFSAITGTTTSSVYALSPSDPPETFIHRATGAASEMSTICGNGASSLSNSKTPLRARGMRRFIRWADLDARSPLSSSFSALDRDSEKSGPQGTNNHNPVSVAPRRLTFQGLSGRGTGFYGNFRPTFSTTTVSRGPRRNGKKGPKRPDAKAFFSNERTYMHWIKFGLLLGSMALTLLSFGKSMGLRVGLVLVLVAMSTLVYATTIFHLRDRWMKQFRLDVLYYDRVGPSILFMALFAAFATNVALTVFKLMKEDGSDDGFNFYNGHQGGALEI